MKQTADCQGCCHIVLSYSGLKGNLLLQQVHFKHANHDQLELASPVGELTFEALPAVDLMNPTLAWLCFLCFFSKPIMHQACHLPDHDLLQFCCWVPCVHMPDHAPLLVPCMLYACELVHAVHWAVIWHSS